MRALVFMEFLAVVVVPDQDGYNDGNYKGVLEFSIIVLYALMTRLLLLQAIKLTWNGVQALTQMAACVMQVFRKGVRNFCRLSRKQKLMFLSACMLCTANGAARVQRAPGHTARQYKSLRKMRTVRPPPERWHDPAQIRSGVL